VIALAYLALGVAWIGHAAIWTAVLSNLYGRALPKPFLKAWRLLTGVAILAFPLLIWSIDLNVQPDDDTWRIWWGLSVIVYAVFCFAIGGVFFPLVTLFRRFEPKPMTPLISERTTSHDFWPTLGPACKGDGKHRYLAGLPGNDLFKLDVTEVSLKLWRLPPALDGLTVLVLSDLHLHGTPSRAWFDAVFDELAKLPTPDVIALVGDYVDTDTHHEWLASLLGKLKWTEGGFAILGNHDWHHHPDRVRGELANLGYTVLGNGWQEMTIRGERVVVVGNEAPWFRPRPDLADAPKDTFRMCLSHSPDQFAWATQNAIDLTLCGHTHGGAIRVPVIGSIFVPCTTGRRYDTGVFGWRFSALVVGRGLSGKEPIRFRCPPQVLRLTLRAVALPDTTQRV
jgi:predicted MPP superfamily phosphohydrolase